MENKNKKYINKSGNVIIIEQDMTGFSPMYQNDTFLRYFTWEKNTPSLQEPYTYEATSLEWSEAETLSEWFENVTHYQYGFDKLAKEAVENGVSTDSLEFYEILCKKLSEHKIFALPIIKVKNAVYPYAIATSPCTLEGDMVGIAWEEEKVISERLGVEITKLSNVASVILKKVALDLKLQNLYLNGEVYQFTLYKDDSLKEELMNLGEFINYDSDEELFEAILSHISGKVEDLDFERVYEPVAVYKDYVRRFMNKNGDTLYIVHDEICDNPLEDLAPTVMNYYTWERNYGSIQEQSEKFNSASDWCDSILGDGAFDEANEYCYELGKGPVGFAKYLCEKLDSKGILAYPILKLEHGTVRYYLGDSIDYWDGSVVGFAWQTKSNLYKEYEVSRLTPKLKDEIYDLVDKSLKTYTDWANGDCYGYQLFTQKDGDDIVDSCYGFVGYSDGEELLDEIKDNLPESITNLEFVDA